MCWNRYQVAGRVQVTELLYLKQTQLEKMAADKAAHQLALERELAIARDEAERVRRCDVLPPAFSVTASVSLLRVRARGVVIGI